MEVKSNIGLDLLTTLSDIVGYQHVLITVDPNRVSVFDLAHLMNLACDCSIDSLEFSPVITFCCLMVTELSEVMHIWSNETLIEA